MNTVEEAFQTDLIYNAAVCSCSKDIMITSRARSRIVLVELVQEKVLPFTTVCTIEHEAKNAESCWIRS